jgi:hypothetical protein
LNLFYLCNKDLNEAIKVIKTIKDTDLYPCPSESKNFPWIWFVWGGNNRILNKYKERFANLNCNKMFFYDKNKKEVIEKIPIIDELAKHIQGLAHSEVIPYFKKLLN